MSKVTTGKVESLILSGNWKKLSNRLGKRKEKDVQELRTLCHTDDDTVNRYLIHEACRSGIDKLGMKAILDAYPDAARLKDDEGSTPLHYLLHYDEQCKMDVLELVLNAFPDAINMQDNYGCTPLFHSVEHNIGVRIEFLALLLRSKKGVDALTIPCTSPSNMLARRGRKEFIGLSRKSFFPETSRNNCSYYRTPLYMIWDIAMNAKDTARFGVRISGSQNNRRERKKLGKRLEKAQMMLEALYLNKPIDPETFKSRFMEVKGRDFLRVSLTRRFRNKGIFRGSVSPISTLGVQTIHEDSNQVGSSQKIYNFEIEGPKERLNNWNQNVDQVGNVGLRRSESTNRRSANQKRSVHSTRSLTCYEIEAREESKREMRKIGKRDKFTNLIDIEDSDNKFRILHAVLTLHTFLPETAYDFAIVHYCDQVHEAEETSANYPLHIVANMHNESDFDREEILSELIELNKDASQRKNNDGRLPLHIALSNQDPWDLSSINIIMDSYKWACFVLDDSLNLYPFEIASINKESYDQLSVIYTLLREAPGNIEAGRHRESSSD